MLEITSKVLVKCRCGGVEHRLIAAEDGDLLLRCPHCGIGYTGVTNTDLILAWNDRNTTLATFTFKVVRTYSDKRVKITPYQVTGLNRDQALIKIGREFPTGDYEIDVQN